MGKGEFRFRPDPCNNAIYCYLDEAMPVYALLAYAKTAKTDMTPDERRTVSKLAAALKAARKKEMK